MRSTHDHPSYPRSVNTFWCITSSRRKGPFFLVSSTHLVEREGYDSKAQYCVAVVLRRPGTRDSQSGRRIYLRLRFDEVDDASKRALNNVKNKDGNAPLFVRVIQMGSASLVDRSNTKANASHNEGTSKVELNDPVAFEPMARERS